MFFATFETLSAKAIGKPLGRKTGNEGISHGDSTGSLEDIS